MAGDPANDLDGSGDADRLLNAARANARRLVGDLESQRAAASSVTALDSGVLDGAVAAARRVLQHLEGYAAGDEGSDDRDEPHRD